MSIPTLHPTRHSMTPDRNSPNNFHSDPHPSPDIETEISCVDDSISTIFKEKGFKITRKLQNTLQGCLYHAIRVKDNFEVVIKATSKKLHQSRISQQHGFCIVVDENIITESIILQHLTVVCKPTFNYIAKFIDFCESTTHYYLSMQYCGDTTLRSFVRRCHKQIKTKQLKLRDYKVVAKFLFWQIASVIHWMHQDMNCCHLNLSLDNIMVENAEYITDSNGSISINPNVHIKLIDFGLSEMFSETNGENDSFLCYKNGITSNQAYTSPKMYHDEVYDARCADMWSLGIILYYLSVGKEPYLYPNSSIDSGYYALTHRCLHRRIHSKYIKSSLFTLITGLLNIDDESRLNCKQVLQSKYLSSYYGKYKDKINLQSQKRQNDLLKDMDNFPYYKLNQ